MWMRRSSGRSVSIREIDLQTGITGRVIEQAGECHSSPNPIPHLQPLLHIAILGLMCFALVSCEGSPKRVVDETFSRCDC